MSTAMTRDVTIPLGQKMREARMNSGLSQRKVAAAMYVDLRTVQKWEHGDTMPSLETLDRFLKLVGATITIGAV